MRVGILGGSFDPVHHAHLIVAEAAADRLRLDQVLFIPTAIQPFKPEGHVASAADRVAMLRCALQGHSRFVLDLREIERGGRSYTVDTLRELRRDFAEDELVLMIGADAAVDFPRWKDAAQIAELAQVVAMSRAGESAPVVAGVARTITVPSIDVAARTVREAVRAGKPVEPLVPHAVADYIRTHKLYEHH